MHAPKHGLMAGSRRERLDTSFGKHPGNCNSVVPGESTDKTFRDGGHQLVGKGKSLTKAMTDLASSGERTQGKIRPSGPRDAGVFLLQKILEWVLWFTRHSIHTLAKASPNPALKMGEDRHCSQDDRFLCAPLVATPNSHGVGSADVLYQRTKATHCKCPKDFRPSEIGRGIA